MQLGIGSLLVDLNCSKFFDSSFEHELSELGFFANIQLINPSLLDNLHTQNCEYP